MRRSKLALLIPVEGPPFLTFFNDSTSAAVFYDAVGGYFQMVDRILATRLCLWCNEDGKYAGMAPNPRANKIWAESMPPSLQRLPGDYLAGPCLITGGVDPQGGTKGIGLVELERLVAMLGEMGERVSL